MCDITAKENKGKRMATSDFGEAMSECHWVIRGGEVDHDHIEESREENQEALAVVQGPSHRMGRREGSLMAEKDPTS